MIQEGVTDIKEMKESHMHNRSPTEESKKEGIEQTKSHSSRKLSSK